MLPLYMYILCENNYPLITLPGNGNGIFSLFFARNKKKNERKKEKRMMMKKKKKKKKIRRKR